MPTTVFVPHANTSVDFPDTWTPDQIQAHLDESQFNQDVADYNPTVAMSRYMGNAALQAQYTPRSTLPVVAGKNVYGLGVEGTQQVLGAVQQDNVQQERERQAQLAQIEQSQRQHELEAARIKHDKMVFANQREMYKLQQSKAEHMAEVKAQLDAQKGFNLPQGAQRIEGGKVVAENPKADAAKPSYHIVADGKGGFGWADLKDAVNGDGSPKIIAPAPPQYLDVGPNGTVVNRANIEAGPVFKNPGPATSPYANVTTDRYGDMTGLDKRIGKVVVIQENPALRARTIALESKGPLGLAEKKDLFNRLVAAKRQDGTPYFNEEQAAYFANQLGEPTSESAAPPQGSKPAPSVPAQTPQPAATGVRYRLPDGRIVEAE